LKRDWRRPVTSTYLDGFEARYRSISVPCPLSP